MSERSERNTINIFQQLPRYLGEKLVDRALPTKVIDVGHGLTRARGFRQLENRDIFFLTTHVSKSDEPREYPLLVWSSRELQDDRIIVPNALDQHTAVNQTLGKAMGIDLYPVVTKDAQKRGAGLDHKVGFGNLSYFRAVHERTGNREDPATVFLAPSAGMRPTLGEPETQAAEFLMTMGGENAVAVFLGVEIDGVEDYHGCDKLNVRKQYTISIGNGFTSEEILEKLKNYRRESRLPEPRHNRPYANLDQWIYETQFPDLVSENYKT